MEYLFGTGEGHLPERADHIAQRHGATLVNFTDPGTREKRHWFACRNLGFPFNQGRARVVMELLRREGVLHPL